MSESFAHSRLVDALEKHVKLNILPYTRGFLFKDLQYKNPTDVPPLINGYRPDIFVDNSYPHKSIIGEAKTRNDLEQRHTEEQLTAFLVYCSRSADTSIMLAVPWDTVRLAKAILQRINKKNNLNFVEAYILEKLPG
jgi:hypothetical protein